MVSETLILPRIKGAYLVGGALRDRIVNQEPVDYDVVTKNDPRDLARKLATDLGGKQVSIGHSAHRLHRVVWAKGIIDVTPIQGASIEEDINQRDFSINAIAQDLDSGRIIDPLRGVEDLERGRVRMVSARALIRDPVRLVRAYRIAAQFAFDIDSQTSAAIAASASLVRLSAVERVAAEFKKILTAANSHPYLCRMAEAGLLFNIIPELESSWALPPGSHPPWPVLELYPLACLEQVIKACPTLFAKHCHRIKPCVCAQDAALLKWAMLLTGPGTAARQTVDRSPGLATGGSPQALARLAESCGKRMKLARKEIHYLASIAHHQAEALALCTSSDKAVAGRETVTRFFLAGGCHTPDLLIHALAVAQSWRGHRQPSNLPIVAEQLIRRFFDRFMPRRAQPPLVTGHDLMAEFGLTPSPAFKTILAEVELAWLSEQIDSRSAAFTLIERMLKQED